MEKEYKIVTTKLCTGLGKGMHIQVKCPEA